MRKNIIETFTGAFVLAVAAFFIFFAYKNAGLKTYTKTYNLIAKFNSADGINTGSDIKIAGVKIGSVDKYNLDTENYMAVLNLKIDETIRLPKDSSAQIVSSGLLGEKYLLLTPGASDDLMNSGDEIKYTQSSISIENLIGKMVFSSDKK